MSRRARVMVVEESSAETRRLWTELRGDGFDVVAAPLAESASVFGSGPRPDVLILNLLAAGDDSGRERYGDLAAGLASRVGMRRLPILALGETTDERPLGVAEMLISPVSPGRIAARAAALARVATMQAELLRRFETMRDYGLDAMPPRFPDAPETLDVLVLGTGTHFIPFQNALQARAQFTGAFTAGSAIDYLARASFDAVVVDGPTDEAAATVTRLRADPRGQAVPILVAGRFAPEESEALFEAGAADVIAPDARPRDLVARLEALAVETRLRRSLTASYADTRRLISNDALSGLFGRGFALAHLDRLIAEQRATEEPISVIGLEIADLDAVNRRHGHAVGDRLIRQVGKLIGLVTRAEDLAARIGAGRFVVLVPGATEDRAEVAARRVSGILAATRFGFDGLVEPIETTIVARVTEAEDADTADGLVERLFQRAD